MSKYTTQLRWIVEQAKADGIDPFEKLGLDSYPIYDENHRQELNQKIVNHFWESEIGFETAGMFAFAMRRKMNEIMPYYNQRYESAKLEIDPLNEIDVRYSTDETRNVETTAKTSSESESASNSKDRNVFEDTPMGMLDTDPSAIEQLKYATNVTYDDGSTNSSDNSTSNSSGTNDMKRNEGRTEKGHRQSQAKLMDDYRKTFVNVDMEIIGELETLFMGLW